MMSLKNLVVSVFTLSTFCLCGEGVIDTNGNVVSNETDWGDIDGDATKVIDIKNLIAPNYSDITNFVFSNYGYPFTGWTNNHPELNLSQPIFTRFKNGSEMVYCWKYTATNGTGSVVGNPHYIMSNVDGGDALVLSDMLDGTNIVFQRSGTAIYTNSFGLATLDNLTPYVKHTQLDLALTEYVSNETLENYDASYKMVDGISTENQTIQLVMTTNNPAGNLDIALPTNGRCKDWIVYVISYNADMPLVLPPADYWIKNEAATNAIPAGVPTALYFSQISSEGVFTLGRQEYIPLTVESNRNYRMKEMIRKMTSKAKKSVPRSRATTLRALSK